MVNKVLVNKTWVNITLVNTTHQARLDEEHMASVAREEALTRQHQAELDLLNSIIGALVLENATF